MLMVVSMTMILALAAAVPLVAAHYLARLPFAPECPQCRSMTGQPQPHTLVDRLCALMAATPVRRCGRCGWAGRMRWRLAGERARTTQRHG
ncbi:MAG TPA: hypothetical protein VFX98_05730 [Longimicrobiaceae bacterium]|nr:hypothetical protein [Longimicrobiaceae bacterium]